MPFSDQPRTTALSSVYGKIAQVLIVVPGNSPVEMLRVLRTRQGLWEALEDRVCFFIYGHTKELGPRKLEYLGKRELDEENGTYQGISSKIMKALIEKADQEGNLNLVQLKPAARCPVNGFPSLMEYAQDPFIVLKGSDNSTILLKCENNPNERNRFIADDLADTGRVSLKPSQLTYQGGNLLFGNDYAIMGRDCYEKNLVWAEKQKMKASDLETQIKEELGVEHLIVPDIGFAPPLEGQSAIRWGDGFQALYHLDLFLTLGGKHPARNEEIIYIGDLVPFFDPDRPHNPSGKVRAQEHFNRLKKMLDDTADFFRSYTVIDQKGPNFHVVRVPLVWENKGASSAVLRSYNNCLAQDLGKSKAFFLPMYDDHRRLIRHPRSNETRVQDFFSAFGAEVKWVEGNFSELSETAASLHCIVKVLHRT